MITSNAKNISVLLLLIFFIGTSFSQDSKSVVTPGVLFEALALNHDISTNLRPVYSSPTDLAVSSDGKYIFVAEQTAKRISIVERTGKKVFKRIKLPNEITGFAISKDDSKIYATCASELWPAGFVHEIDVASGKSVRKVAVGHMARNPVLSPDEKTLYVCNLFNEDISVINVSSMKETQRIKMVREPYSAAITPDGKTLVVSNSLPHQKSTDSLVISSTISLVNTQNNEVVNVPLFLDGKVFGTHSVFGIAITNNGKYAFVSHLIGQINIPATRIDFGWVHLNCMSLIDIENKKLLNCFTIDEMSDLGAGNPWDIEITDDDKYVCIAHSGSEQVSIYDVDSLIAFQAKSKGTSLHNKFLYGLVPRTIISVKSKGPRALTIYENKLYTAGYFSDFIEEIDISISTKKPSAETISLTETPQVMNSLRQGEYYFYSATICNQKWQSCHSCHPFTRPDGMNWILNEAGGYQTSKNAKSMLYSWWTPPTNWAAKRTDAYESIRMGIKLELFLQPTENVAVCLDTFFMYLKPVPSPHLVKGKLAESAKRGKTLYYDKQKTDCIVCHPAPLFTIVGNGSKRQGFIDDPTESQIVTPHLIEAWRTFPYDHLGSTSLKEIIEDYPGHTDAPKSLNESELNDLYEYILSL